MIKVGLPEAAVRHKMVRDGVPAGVMDQLVFTTKSAPGGRQEEAGQIGGGIQAVPAHSSALASSQTAPPPVDLEPYRYASFQVTI
jgi:hypothetical protein